VCLVLLVSCLFFTVLLSFVYASPFSLIFFLMVSVCFCRLYFFVNFSRSFCPLHRFRLLAGRLFFFGSASLFFVLLGHALRSPAVGSRCASLSPARPFGLAAFWPASRSSLRLRRGEPCSIGGRSLFGSGFYTPPASRLVRVSVLRCAVWGAALWVRRDGWVSFPLCLLPCCFPPAFFFLRSPRCAANCWLPFLECLAAGLLRYPSAPPARRGVVRFWGFRSCALVSDSSPWLPGTLSAPSPVALLCGRFVSFLPLSARPVFGRLWTRSCGDFQRRALLRALLLVSFCRAGAVDSWAFGILDSSLSTSCAAVGSRCAPARDSCLFPRWFFSLAFLP